MYNKKSIIIGIMLIAVVFLSIGYSYFSTTLYISGTSNITTNWNVYFESISEGVIFGTAENASTPSVSGTSATISVNLATPGDKIVYELILKNGGDFDAVIEDVIAKAEGSSAIIYSIEGISKGDKLAKGASKTITLSVEYDYYVTSQPEITNKTLTVSILANQDIGQEVEGGSSATLLFNKESQSDLTITSQEDVSTFEAVQVDGETVDSSNYIVTSGSTIVTLKKEYLNSLSAGVHTIDIVSANNTSSTTFEVSTIKSSISLVETIFKTNKVYADNVASEFVTSNTGIDFSQVNSDTNGKGLYYTSTNTEDNGTTYYFRGNVENNYVKFGKDTDGNDIIWRIIRINEDGSVRLITQDSIGTSEFNLNYDDNAYVGYMYGTPGSSTYSATHANINDSAVKTLVDTWYEDTLSSYSNYLVDAGFCNDRSLATSAGLWHSSDTALGYSQNTTIYGAAGRLVDINDLIKEDAQPQFICPNESNDLFTTSASTKGNKALTNPIGLITMDELIYAGGTLWDIGDEMYLNEITTWTMSPFHYAFHGHEGIYVGFLENDEGFYYNFIYFDEDVSPVINIKGNLIASGTGVAENPYIIPTN